MIKKLLLILTYTVCQHIFAINNNAIIVNSIISKSAQQQNITPGHIILELESGKFNLPHQEWAPSTEKIAIISGKVFVNKLAGHWQTKPLPKECINTVQPGEILTIAGKINNKTLTKLSCNLSKQQITK